jgi:hypothetical protein
MEQGLRKFLILSYSIKMAPRTPVICKGRASSRCKGASKSCLFVSRKKPGFCGYCKRRIIKNKTSKQAKEPRTRRTRKNK